MQDTTFQSLRLSDLAIACYMYNALTPFNKALHLLKKSTSGSIDLADPADRNSVLDWLNAWGCRLPRARSHDPLLTWLKRGGINLFPTRKGIWEVDDQELATAAAAYDRLRKDLGPTVASKVLFALRPEALMPWDEAMRKNYKCDGSEKSYINFLVIIRDLSYRIGELCKANGFDVLELPHRIDRDGSTVLELINEYIWITITRKCKLPSAKSLTLWAGWGLSAKKN